jgi:hypothetical protein
MRRYQSMAFVRQRGVALFVGLVFLVILSLVAVIAMQGTLIEMRMVTNVARHEQAFETSEGLRTIPLTVFDEHVFNRGWPTGMGGSLPDADFTADMGLSSQLFDKLKAGIHKDSGVPEMLYSSLGAGESLYSPSTWATDVSMAIDDPSTGDEDLAANIAIVPDGAVLAEGSGTAVAAGYRGLGSGAAGGGGNLYFEVKSIATAPANGRAVTMSQYRQAIRN